MRVFMFLSHPTNPHGHFLALAPWEEHRSITFLGTVMAMGSHFRS